MKRPMKLFERLLDTDVKADLLTLFHNDVNLTDSPEGLANKIGRSPAEVQRELEDLVELGVLKKAEVYSYGIDRDREIQEAISTQLALGEASRLQASLAEVSPGVQCVPTGMEIMDDLLPNGVPVASTLLILSDPGAGEENLLTHFVCRYLSGGKTIVYVTLDNFPANIRNNIQQNITSKADWASLIFIDSYSKTIGLQSEEEYATDPENLSAISIAISDILTKGKVSMIVLNSFNTLVQKRGFGPAIEFLRVLIARSRQAKCLCLATMNRKAHHPAMLASAQDIVDGVIELKVDETPEGTTRALRILKMVGVKYLTTWAPYEISDDGELVQVAPRIVGAQSSVNGSRHFL